MKIQTNMKKVAFTALSTMLLCGTAWGSTLNIKNDHSGVVDVIIEAGDGKLLTSDKEAEKLILKPSEKHSSEVTQEKLGGQDTFSITATVKMPSLDNKCGPLLVSKNYDIVFTESKTGGIICVANPTN